MCVPARVLCAAGTEARRGWEGRPGGRGFLCARVELGGARCARARAGRGALCAHVG